MVNLGLAGPAGCGKSTVADYLVARYGFVKYAFSDALYREVAEAFGLEDESLLRDRRTKEVRTDMLRLDACEDKNFVDIAIDLAMIALHEPADLGPLILKRALSPRQILQWWGTEYRRAQDPDYWIIQVEDWMFQLDRAVAYPEQKPQFFVNDTVRFKNEHEWVKTFDGGNIWHIRRDGLEPVNAHESENPLPVLPGERELWNNDTLARLHYGIDLLMTTSARFVRVEKAE